MSVETALVVDDSKSARVMLGRLLKQSGVASSFAESAEEALALLKHSRPDMIFMDHMMPGMDGLTALKKIQMNDQIAQIPVVMYTSKEGREYESTAKQSGAKGILVKPANHGVVAGVLSDINAYLDSLERYPVNAAEVMPIKSSKTCSVDIEVVDPCNDDVTMLPAPMEGSLDSLPLGDANHSAEEPVVMTDDLKGLIDSQALTVIRSILQPTSPDLKTSLVIRMLESKRKEVMSNFHRSNIEPLQAELKKISAQLVQPSDIQSIYSRLNDLSGELQRFREGFEQLDSRSTELDGFISDCAENSISKLELNEELESIKDYIHKEVIRQIHPLESGLHSKLNLVDRSKKEYRLFVGSLVDDVAAHLEVRYLKKAVKVTEESSNDRSLTDHSTSETSTLNSNLVILSLFFSVSVSLFLLIQNFM